MAGFQYSIEIFRASVTWVVYDKKHLDSFQYSIEIFVNKPPRIIIEEPTSIEVFQYSIEIFNCVCYKDILTIYVPNFQYSIEIFISTVPEKSMTLN